MNDAQIEALAEEITMEVFAILDIPNIDILKRDQVYNGILFIFKEKQP
jgi:hypothetical protein